MDPLAPKLLKPPQKHQRKTVVALSGLTRHLCASTSDDAKWREGAPLTPDAASLDQCRTHHHRLDRQNLSQGDGGTSKLRRLNEGEWTPDPLIMDLDGWI